MFTKMVEFHNVSGAWVHHKVTRDENEINRVLAFVMVEKYRKTGTVKRIEDNGFDMVVYWTCVLKSVFYMI